MHCLTTLVNDNHVDNKGNSSVCTVYYASIVNNRPKMDLFYKKNFLPLKVNGKSQNLSSLPKMAKKCTLSLGYPNLKKESDQLTLLQGLIRLSLVTSGPSCSKLTMSLVNDSLKFTWSDTQIC